MREEAGSSVKWVDEPAHLLTTRTTYDTVAPDYARLLPDLRAETDLDRAMLATFAAWLWEHTLDRSPTSAAVPAA